MADAAAFDLVAERLERSTSLDRLEARGTLRLALKSAGFDSRSIRIDELRAVVECVVPQELVARGIDEPHAVVDDLKRALDRVHDTAGGDSPESIFERLGGAD